MLLDLVVETIGLLVVEVDLVWVDLEVDLEDHMLELVMEVQNHLLGQEQVLYKVQVLEGEEEMITHLEYFMEEMAVPASSSSHILHKTYSNSNK